MAEITRRMRLGLPVPETWLVPPKAYELRQDLEPTLRRYAQRGCHGCSPDRGRGRTSEEIPRRRPSMEMNDQTDGA